MNASHQEPWEPVRKVRTYEQVMAQIEKRITDGHLGPGDRLPSEREFSQLLGVSRPSLREALRVLQALGIVEVRTGGGPEGGSVFVGHPGSGFADLLRTTSLYRSIEPAVREPLLDAIAERIRTRLGDRAPRRYLSVLRVGRRAA